jgi:ketosteroid isomerase-like protein
MMANDFEKKAIAERFLELLRNRDWVTMRSVFTDDAIWCLPGSNKISGLAEGADAVVERARLIASYGLNFALKNILIGPEGVALSLNNTARRGDLVLDEHLATVCQIRDGKIARIDTYLSDVPMMNAFFV